jgi:hypothetical protein
MKWTKKEGKEEEALESMRIMIVPPPTKNDTKNEK